MKTISMSLTVESIGAAIKELNAYKEQIKRKTAMLCERLALLGAQEASVRFATAMYDGNNDTAVSVEPTLTGWSIIASGQAVCFIEFGAGVYHNAAEPYPNPRPSGVVGIGQYGKGYGKRRMWGYYDEAGELVKTRGNPAGMPMYYATVEMERAVAQIAKEVFSA